MKKVVIVIIGPKCEHKIKAVLSFCQNLRKERKMRTKVDFAASKA